MRTGLVVLNYNDAERTIKLVRRAAEMHVLNAICVTDNASTDDSGIRSTGRWDRL